MLDETGMDGGNYLELVQLYLIVATCQARVKTNMSPFHCYYFIKTSSALR